MFLYNMNNIFRDPRIPQVRKILQELKLTRDCTVYVNDLDELVVFCKDTAIYCIPLTGEFHITPIAFDVSWLEMIEQEDHIATDMRLLFNLQAIWANIRRFVTCKDSIVAHCDDLRVDPEYESLLSMKAGESVKFYHLIWNSLNTDILIPVFNGFPSLNKADKIGITVYNEVVDFLVDYLIYKKKINREIHMYFRILKFQ